MLYFLICHGRRAEWMNLQNNKYQTKLEKDKKFIKITKTTIPSKWYCLNCCLCQGKACSVSRMDQSELDVKFISLLYSMMYRSHMERNGYL